MEKRKSIVYWIATGLLAFGMAESGLAQIFHVKEMEDLVGALGYPMYLLYIIGVWKLLGVAAILLPGFKLLKEWAYAGFFFLMTGALVSHLAAGDYDVKALAGPVMQSVFIMLSWYYRPVSRKIVPADR